MSYGTGRPAILKDDESIWQCRLLLQHPLAIEDDMRLVSTVELMAIRERVNNNLSPTFEHPVDEHTFNVLRDADLEFRNWYNTWDQAFSQKYEDAGESASVRDGAFDTNDNTRSFLSTKLANSAPSRRTLSQCDRSQRYRRSRGCSNNAAGTKRSCHQVHTAWPANPGYHCQFAGVQRRNEIWYVRGAM